MPVLVRQLGHSSSRRPGAPKGNRNAFKHGRYTAEAIASRREIGLLYRGGELRQRMRCRAINSR